ncbi:MAG: tetratricopeptide repeat protein, partial [Gammaproteobacteria bacterium]
AIAIDAKVAVFHINLGIALKGLGRPQDAVHHYQQALALQPDSAEAHNNLGLAWKELGRLDAALRHYGQALALRPDYANAHINRGNAYQAQGQPEQAIPCYERALQINPAAAEAHNNRALALKELGRLQDAITGYQRALALQPDYASAQLNLGNALQAAGQVDQAVACYERALELQPDWAEAHNYLGIVLLIQAKVEEAIHSCKRALSLKPDYAGAHLNLGNALQVAGRPEEAIRSYEQALKLQPDFAAAQNNLLGTINHSSQYTPADIFNKHVEIAKLQEQALAKHIKPHTNLRDPERRLNIGYVSPDFREHSVAYFIEPILAHHDHERFEIFAYYNNNQNDPVTQRLQGHCQHWRNITTLSDDDTTELIRRDEIDILVDLSGHSAANRLLVFARKPAPIQVAYLGYPNTTGMTAMDYRLTDGWADPIGASESLYTEELVRLPQGFLCYGPPADSPPVHKLPALETGSIMFGCFNNSAKITPQVITLWAGILQAVPGSRLLLKSRQMGDRGVQMRYAALFAEHGIGRERVEMMGQVPDNRSHLGLYNRVDIALDPFPYNGTTTTCEALWMGVPVVTLAGGRHAGRVGASILSSIGMPEWIAKDSGTYRSSVLGLASDLDRLAALRESLRERLAASALMEAQRFTHELETTYREMWHTWCKKCGASPHIA